MDLYNVKKALQEPRVIVAMDDMIVEAKEPQQRSLYDTLEEGQSIESLHGRLVPMFEFNYYLDELIRRGDEAILTPRFKKAINLIDVHFSPSVEQEWRGASDRAEMTLFCQSGKVFLEEHVTGYPKDLIIGDVEVSAHTGWNDFNSLVRVWHTMKAELNKKLELICGAELFSNQ